MQKKQMGVASPPIKMACSINNILVLLIIAVGIFVVYRYVKSLENELKIVRKDVQTMKTNETKNVQYGKPLDNVCTYLIWKLLRTELFVSNYKPR